MILVHFMTLGLKNDAGGYLVVVTFVFLLTEMGTRVLGLGLESDSSPDLVGLGLGLESQTFGLGLDSRHAGLDSDSDFGTRTGLDNLRS
jgi:hypothetical protein